MQNVIGMNETPIIIFLISSSFKFWGC